MTLFLALGDNTHLFMLSWTASDCQQSMALLLNFTYVTGVEVQGLEVLHNLDIDSEIGLQDGIHCWRYVCKPANFWIFWWWKDFQRACFTWAKQSSQTSVRWKMLWHWNMEGVPVHVATCAISESFQSFPSRFYAFMRHTWVILDKPEHYARSMEEVP